MLLAGLKFSSLFPQSNTLVKVAENDLLVRCQEVNMRDSLVRRPEVGSHRF